MNIRTTLIASGLIAAGLVSGAAQAALQGRDLNGSAGSFEAYYDTVLDITWLANANYGAGSSFDNVGANSATTTDGKMTWLNANAWADSLSFTDGVNVYDNWHLPTVAPVNGVSFNYNNSSTGSTDEGINISEQGTVFAGSTGSEMAHLFYNTLNNPGYYTVTGAVSGCYVNSGDTCLDNPTPFTNLQSNLYWSATERAAGPVHAWVFNFAIGDQFTLDKEVSLYALAVSPGDIAAVPEAQTYALMLAGLGLIGWRARRRG